MKKIITILIMLMMTSSLVACGKKDSGPVGELLDKGYEIRQFYVQNTDQKTFESLFVKDDSYIWVSGNLDDATHEKLMNATSNKETYEIIKEVKDIKTEDVSSEYPKQSDLDKYIGKTLADVEKDGYEFFLSYVDEKGTNLYLEKDGFNYSALCEKSLTEDEFNKLSQEEQKQLVIKKLIVLGKTLPTNIDDTNINVFEGVEVSEQIKQSPLYEYFTNGYMINSSFSSDQDIKVVLCNYTDGKVIYAELASNKDVLEQLNNAYKTENSNLEVAKILCSLEVKAVKDVTDLVPSREELNKNKTLGDLITNGYEMKDHYANSGSIMFTFGNDKLELFVSVNSDLTDEQIDALTEDELKALEIGYVGFSGFDINYNPFTQ